MADSDYEIFSRLHRWFLVLFFLSVFSRVIVLTKGKYIRCLGLQSSGKMIILSPDQRETSKAINDRKKQQWSYRPNGLVSDWLSFLLIWSPFYLVTPARAGDLRSCTIGAYDCLFTNLPVRLFKEWHQFLSFGLKKKKREFRPSKPCPEELLDHHDELCRWHEQIFFV